MESYSQVVLQKITQLPENFSCKIQLREVSKLHLKTSQLDFA